MCCAHRLYCPIQCGHKQCFYLQGLASQNAFFKIKPADFSAFVDLYLFKIPARPYSTCPLTILSSTVWTQAMFPPTRFSLARWLFRIKPAVFSAFVKLLPVEKLASTIRAHWQYCLLQKPADFSAFVNLYRWFEAVLFCKEACDDLHLFCLFYDAKNKTKI